MQLVDSHCHLDRIDYSKLGLSLNNIVVHARENSIVHMLCVNVNLQEFSAMKSSTEVYSDISLSVGIHPGDDEVLSPDFSLLELLAKDNRVVAIGETGLDYYYCKDSINQQKLAFQQQIEIAKFIAKPLIIHTRAAKSDTIGILKDQNAGAVGGVMHCFTEDWETAKQALDLGFYISFSGIITFNNAQELQEVLKKVPLDRLLIETDSPYLAPHPYRGKINQPAYLVKVAQKVADLKCLDLEKLAEITSENFSQLFSVKL